VLCCAGLRWVEQWCSRNECVAQNQCPPLSLDREATEIFLSALGLALIATEIAFLEEQLVLVQQA
jgi:hypothetical protein